MEHDDPRPRTAEAIMALPIGPAFGMREEVIEGRTIRRPIAPDVVAIFHEEHDIISVADGQGIWMLGRYADGRWFRRRV